MNDRREPTLSGREPLSSPLDDADTPTSVKVGDASSRRAKRRPAPVSQRVVEVKSPLAPLAVVAAVVALAVSALLFWQVSTLNKEKQQLIDSVAKADQRIVQLERKLDLTGDASEQSLASLSAGVSDLDALVKENISEIRKLWGVANDRNRKAIEENKKAAEEAAGAAKSAKAENQKELAALQAKLAEVQGELAVLKEVQESQQAAFDQSRSAAADVQTLKTNLTSRIAANEEAIKAIDAFRLQINRRLLEMGASAQ